MSSYPFSLAGALFFGLVLITNASRAADINSPEEEIRGLTQALLNAVAVGDTSVWDAHLHESLIHMDENGKVRTKAELLTELRPLPPGLDGRLEIAEFSLTLNGDLAVAAHEDQEYLKYHGQEIHARFRSLDVWRRTESGWKLIGQHVAAVPSDPPAIVMDQDKLCEFAGTYELTEEIKTELACETGRLIARRPGRPDAIFLPEASDVFFSPGSPRSRRIFRRDAYGEISGFSDRREGHDIIWRRE